MARSADTRAHLQREALRLFVEQGYDQTTTAQIAAAAGVTQMTFFRHFPAKELVVVDDPYDPDIARAVVEQPRELPALERVRRGLMVAWSRLPGDVDEDLRLRLRIGANHAGLRARMRENNTVTERSVSEALMEDGVPRTEAVVAAGAVIGGLHAALLQWATDPESSDLGEAIRAALTVLQPRVLP
jgi:AcrR family transcriptional regulator